MKIHSILHSIKKNLTKNPSKREIEKRQKLVPIYLTIISIMTALTKINSIIPQNLTNNSTNLSETESSLELGVQPVLNYLLAIACVLFFVFIIGYYIILDSPSRKIPNILGLFASVCFGSIFTFNLLLLANYTNLERWHLILLFLAFLLIH